MATFTHAQLEELWLLAGGSQATADTAAAIAQAESSGCQYAKHGPIDDRPVKQCTYRYSNRENSYGLWQINRRAHPQYSAATLYNAAGNASAAVAIAKGGASFTAWTTYKLGTYKAYLQSGGTPAPQPGPTTPPTAGNQTPNMHHGWADLANSLNRHLPRQLAKSDTATKAAYRALAHRSRRGR